ncbi:14311_t:CDS:1, partial [Rhizophagus irregularis]
MSKVHTLNDIKDREGGSYKKPGHRLGSAYEQELEKKLRSVTEFNSEINDLSEKLVDKYNEREKEYQRSYSDIGNKIGQLNASSVKVRSQLISERKSHSESQRELEAKYTAEIQSLKSSIKTLKREATLTQKASSADKIKILSLEVKIRELEGKLEDIDLERTYHGLDVIGGMIENLAQINGPFGTNPSDPDPKEIDSLRLELEQVKEDRNSKKYEIECMEKGIEASNNIYKRELDIRSSERLKMMEENS